MSRVSPVVLHEGSIASGKTTVGKRLMASGLFRVVEEPVLDWQESGLLGRFYQDSKRWALAFQLAAFQSRARAWQQLLQRRNAEGEQEGVVTIMERSVFADRYVFATNCHLNFGFIDDLEWRIYCDVWETFMVVLCGSLPNVLPPDLIVYQYTPAVTCLERVEERGRPEEIHGGITLPYLKSLESVHDGWLLPGFDGTLTPADNRLVLGRARAAIMGVKTVDGAPELAEIGVPVLVINGRIGYAPKELHAAIMEAVSS